MALQLLIKKKANKFEGILIYQDVTYQWGEDPDVGRQAHRS